MKKIFFIGLLSALTSFTVHATEETKLALAENPPPYAENDFLAALASSNAKEMLTYAENKKHDHLKRWAMATVATAYEDDGNASFWLARRLSTRVVKV